MLGTSQNDSALARRDSGIETNYRARLSSRIATALAQFIATAGQLGYYRRDLNLKHAALQMASLAIHPISIEPRIMHAAYGFGRDELRSPEWLASLESDLERLFRV